MVNFFDAHKKMNESFVEETNVKNVVEEVPEEVPEEPKREDD